MEAGGGGRIKERTQARLLTVSALTWHTIASATFCYLKQSHRASPSSRRGENLYLLREEPSCKGNRHRGRIVFTLAVYPNIYFTEVISHGISLPKMKLHVDNWKESCGLSLSLVRTTGHFGECRYDFRYLKRYVYFLQFPKILNLMFLSSNLKMPYTFKVTKDF